jgi:uncharacterized protein YyaL (SSP411 family)
MEHETIEDPSLADQLNRDFISIKVDREERPDIDRVYMTFVQATTGAGGWPMTVFLTPDLHPFFGGTYFPPTSRWGRPGFSDVLAQLSKAWRDDPARVQASAASLLAQLRDTVASTAAAELAPVPSVEAVTAGISQFAQAYDRRHGGFGGAPKFPRPSELLFLLDGWALTHRHEARQMTLDTLRAMALGGIHDHLGGGFHRYSVDAEWRVPHFEKMLYDQAQLVLAYVGASQASGESFYADVAEDTLDYVRHDMTAPDGAFYSAEDADSLVPGGGPEKREGAFYVFSAAEVDRLFGADAPIVRRRLGIEDAGNAPSDPQGEFRGLNIPYVAQSVDEIAARTGRTAQEVFAVLGEMRERLYEAQAERPRPHRDDKVITAWNGLMIAAFARAARVLVDSPRRDAWREMAVRAAQSVRRTLWRDRVLLRRYRDGEAAVEGFCEDYACLAYGLIELFQATADPEWLDWALQLTDLQTERFRDPADGGWFSTTGEDPTVLLRLKEDYDGAEPAAASVTVRNLLTLAHITGEGRFADLAQRSLERYGAELGRVARVMPLMVSNVAAWHARASQIVIVGEPGEERTALERVVAKRYLPFAVTLTIAPGDVQQALGVRLPWLDAMAPVEGKPAAYVCSNFTCQAPVTTANELEQMLEDSEPPQAPRIIL